MTDRQCEFLAKVAFLVLLAGMVSYILLPLSFLLPGITAEIALWLPCSRIPVVSRRFGLGQALQTAPKTRWLGKAAL